jgi:hypothetical protein
MSLVSLLWPSTFTSLNLAGPKHDNDDNDDDEDALSSVISLNLATSVSRAQSVAISRDLVVETTVL